MSKPGIGELIVEEAERRGLDIVDLATELLTAADMAQDESIDSRRQELAFKLACSTGELIEDIRRTARNRQRALKRRQAKEAA